MRLLVVGRLSGQLATAVKMAMAHGAKVQHVERGAAGLAAGEPGGPLLAAEAEGIEQIEGAIMVVAGLHAVLDIGQRGGKGGEVGFLRQVADGGAGLDKARALIRLDQPRRNHALVGDEERLFEAECLAHLCQLGGTARAEADFRHIVNRRHLLSPDIKFSHIHRLAKEVYERPIPE